MLFAPSAGAQSTDDWLGADKALHFSASAAIAGGSYALSTLWFDDTAPRVVFGASVGFAAGVGKELIDLAGYGGPSWRDLAWDALGTGVGVVAAWAVDRALRPTPAPPPVTCPLPGRARWGASPSFQARGVSLTLWW